LGSGYGILHSAPAVCLFPPSLNYWKIIGIIVSVIHLLTSFGQSLSTVWFTNYIAGVVRKIGVIGILMHVRLFANLITTDSWNVCNA